MKYLNDFSTKHRIKFHIFLGVGDYSEPILFHARKVLRLRLS